MGISMTSDILLKKLSNILLGSNHLQKNHPSLFNESHKSGLAYQNFNYLVFTGREDILPIIRKFGRWPDRS